MATEMQEKLERWENAVKTVKRLKREINQAECELKNAENGLGKFLTPKEPGIGENFNLWVRKEGVGRDKLLTVTVVDSTTYTLKWDNRV